MPGFQLITGSAVDSIRLLNFWEKNGRFTRVNQTHLLLIISVFGSLPAYWDTGAWNETIRILQARKSWKGWSDKWVTRQNTFFPLKVCWSSSGTGCALQVPAEYRAIDSQGSASQEMGTRQCTVVAEKKIGIPADFHILFVISSFLSAWKNEKRVCKYAAGL